MSIKVVGIDIAKNLFQVCVLGTNGQILSNRKIKRDKLLDTVPQTIHSNLLLQWSHVQLLIIGAEHFKS